MTSQYRATDGLAPDPEASSSTPDAEDSPLTGTLGRLRSAGTWLMNLPWWAYSGLVLLVAVVRSGPAPLDPAFVTQLQQAAAAFPRPANWMSSSLGPLLFAKVLSPPMAVYWVVGVVLWLLLLGVLTWRCQRAGPWGRVALLLVALSPTFTVTVQLMGHYDSITVVGATVMALARRRSVVMAGALICCLGNPEQAVVSAGCLAAVWWATGSRDRLVGFIPAMALIVVYTGALELWVNSGMVSAGASRADGILDPTALAEAIRRFLADAPLMIFSFFGALWLPVLLCLSRIRRSRRLIATLAVIGVPALFAITTIDGTRVFAVTVTAPVTALLVATWRAHWSSRPPEPALVGTLAVGLLVIPAINVLPAPDGRYVRLPYDLILHYLGWLRT